MWLGISRLLNFQINQINQIKTNNIYIIKSEFHIVLKYQLKLILVSVTE